MKKRYYNMLAIPALTVIIFCLLSGFRSENPQSAVKALVNQRANILQSTWSGDIPDGEAEKELRKIETETLLKEDLEAIRSDNWGANINAYSLKIKDIKQKKQMFQYTTYEAEILWDSGNQVAADRYNIVLKKENDCFMLTIFEPAKF